MRIPALTCVLLCLFAAPEFTKAQALRGLHAVDIMIERTGNSAEGETIGLTDELLTDQVFVALKRDVPKLLLNQKKAGLPYVHIEITAMKTASSITIACVEFSLVRPVYFAEETPTANREPVLGSVWRQGALFSTGHNDMASMIRDKIAEFLTQFAAAYYKDNP
jgi:hypothetical protein